MSFFISRSSSYLQDLMFYDFLQADVISKINEAFIVTGSLTNSQSKRILINSNRKWSLVSFRQFINYIDSKNYIYGFKWDTDALGETIIPAFVDSLSAETG